MSVHDAAYRQIFSHACVLQSLLDAVLPADLSCLLDRDGGQLLPTSYFSRGGRSRQADLVWRLQRRDCREQYVFLSLEHQSTVDPLMALRMATYSSLLLENLARRQGLKAGRLPLVLPVAVYSGTRRWTAPVCLDALFESAPTLLKRYQPRQEYLLIEQKKQLMNGSLPANSLLGLIFRLHHHESLDELRELVQTLNYNLAGDATQGLRRTLLEWVMHGLLPERLPGVLLPSLKLFSEIPTMLEDRPPIWTEQWMAQGHERGQQSLLRHLVEHRFGPLAPHFQEMLGQGSEADVQAWSLNLLTADSLQQVFTPDF